MRATGEKGTVCPHQSISSLPDLVAAIAAIVGALTSAGVLMWGYRYTKLANKEMLELKASIDERHEFIRAGLRRIEENDVLVHRKLHKAIDASRLASRELIRRFDALLDRATSSEDEEFLDEFNRALTALGNFKESVQALYPIVEGEDPITLTRVQNELSRILIGMRIEKPRRVSNDYAPQLASYKRRLRSIERLLAIKYRLFYKYGGFSRSARGSGVS
jgi:hypothetical protein